jgi:hypothetical protein
MSLPSLTTSSSRQNQAQLNGLRMILASDLHRQSCSAIVHNRPRSSGRRQHQSPFYFRVFYPSSFRMDRSFRVCKSKDDAKQSLGIRTSARVRRSVAVKVCSPNKPFSLFGAQTYTPKCVKHRRAGEETHICFWLAFCQAFYYYIDVAGSRGGG